MRLLNDQALKDLVDRSTPLVAGLPRPKDWFGKDSPIQPSSIDLHIGSIFVPGTQLGQEGAEDKPRTALSLKPGQTAIITTLETLNLAPTIAAIAFPPSSVSQRGLLTTNPGHVDPGYFGPMHFTVINMSREDFNLQGGDIIVTVLFFEMGDPVKVDYRTRNDGVVLGAPAQEQINHLSADFLNITERATDLAKAEIRAAGAKLERIELRLNAIPIVGAIILATLAYLGPQWLGINDLKAKVEKLEVEKRVTKLEERLDAQTQVPPKPAQPVSVPGPASIGLPKQGKK